MMMEHITLAIIHELKRTKLIEKMNAIYDTLKFDFFSLLLIWLSSHINMSLLLWYDEDNENYKDK